MTTATPATAFETGFTDFDHLTDGLHAGEMIVIAERPGTGKTALVMNIAEHVAVVGRKPVGIFSLEMPGRRLLQRMLCSQAGVDLEKVRDGFPLQRIKVKTKEGRL